MNITFIPFPELKTPRLLLRRLTLEDRHDLMWQRSDDRVNQYLERAKSMNIDEATAYVGLIDKNLEEGKSCYWAICFPETRTYIGSVCLWNLQPEKNIAELGYELSPMYQGKGIMSEAIEKALEYGFNLMQAKVITATTHPDNQSSKKILERFGFQPDTGNNYISVEDADGTEPYFLLNF